MGLLALLVAYSYSMFYIIQINFNVSDDSIGLKIFTVLLFSIVVIIYSRLIAVKKKVFKSELIIFFIISFMLISSAYTFMRYGYMDSNFKGLILSFGSRAIPAALMGIVIARSNSIDKIVKWIQPVILVYTISIFSVVLSNQSGYVMDYKLYGLDRQSVSYYAVFALGMNIFLMLYKDYTNQFSIFKSLKWKYVNMIVLIMQIYCTFAGGGRGAFLLMIVFFIFYFANRTKRINISSLLKGVMLIPCILIVTNFISQDDAISSGYYRIVDFFLGGQMLQDSNRQTLYSTAFKGFESGPIFGHGIGSTSYEVGFYSHNVFLDLLVDGGLIAIILFITLLYMFLKNIKRLINIDKNNNIILVIFLSSFIFLLFSGSYLADSGMWFAFGYTFLVPYRQKRTVIQSSE